MNRIATIVPGLNASLSMRNKWVVASVVTLAIAISYLDRQTLPWAIKAIEADFPINNQVKAALDSAFLVTYGLMYVGGGWLLDRMGTRRGFLIIMLFWSLACASHGLAAGVIMLAASRLLLGMGEGGGFPAATRAVAEWFPVRDRATAMGLINAGTAVGAVAAPPLIAAILLYGDWLGLASWRWVFFVTGAFGLVWALWWLLAYRSNPNPQDGAQQIEPGSERISIGALVAQREVQGVMAAKFLSDGAWYFYLFWLPKYLFEAHHFDLKQAATVGWIPYAAAGIGSICGGYLSGRLLRGGLSINAARKIALGASAACMPFVMFVPLLPSVALVIAVFSLAFFGQQSWSTLVMTLPTDMAPKQALGKFAGLVGLSGAFGGIAMGQAAGWMLDNGFSYTPVLAIAASLHIVGFAVICLVIPRIRAISFQREVSP